MSTTIKDKIHFKYNGKSTRDFGILSANLDGGMYEEFFVAEQSIREEKLVDRKTTIFSGVEKEPIEFDLVLAFEDNFTDETIENVVDWLYGVEYYSKLEFEGMDKVFYCMPNGESTITHTGYQEGYIQLSMRTNSPYVFGKMREGGRDSSFNMAWSWSSNGEERFTTEYPNENLLNTSKVSMPYSNDQAQYPIEAELLSDSKDGEYYRAKRISVDKSPRTFSIYNKFSSESIKNCESIAGKTVTVSGRFRSSHKSKVALMARYMTSSGQTIMFPYDEKLVELTEEWQTISITITNFPTNIGSILFTPYRVPIEFFDTVDIADYYIDSQKYKIEVSDHPTAYIESEEENKTTAYPQYIGYSDRYSENYSDYNWFKINSKAMKIDLKGKINPEVIIKIRQKENGSIKINMNGYNVQINNLLKDETIKIYPNEEDIESDRINTYHYNDYIGDLSKLGLLRKDNVLTVTGDCEVEYYYQPYYNK